MKTLQAMKAEMLTNSDVQYEMRKRAAHPCSTPYAVMADALRTFQPQANTAA